MEQPQIQAIMENAPFFMYALDSDLRLINANKSWFEAYERLWNIRPAIGAKMPFVKKQIITEVLQLAYQRTLKGEILQIEEQVDSLDGFSKNWFELHLSPIKEAERIVGVLVIAWDITDKKKTASKLVEWEVKFDDFMNKANDAIFIADTQMGNILYANERAQTLMGMTLAELQKMHHTELHPIRLRDEYKKLFKKFVETNTRITQLFLIVNKAGNEIPVDISSGLIDYRGKKALQGVFRDMSLHLENQTALQTQKEFYEKILNHIPIDIAVLDKDDRYIYLNPKAVKDQELRNWLIGKQILDYYTYRNLPTERGEEKQRQLNIVHKTNAPTKWEDCIIDKKGKASYLLRRFTPILNEEGGGSMSVFTGENVTHLKQAQQQLLGSEQRYRNLVETTTDWIWETNKEGNFTYCSPQILDILGYTPRETVGKNVTYFARPEDASNKWIMFKDIWAKGDNFLLEELEYKHKNGETVLLQTSGAPIFNHNWELTHYRGIARDVTAQKNAEHLLQNTLKELEDRNFELDSFVYKVSHDLRAPLSSMLGLLNLMQIETDQKRLTEYVELMQGRAQKLDNFIKTVLTYSQNLNQGIEPVRINFEKIISQCMDELQYMPLASDIRWALVQTGLSDFYNDEFRLITIFKNFLSNAIKYQKSNEEEGMLNIHAHITDTYVHISIQDNGIGIMPEHLPKVFDMFYRATEKSEGSGLGLYIVKQALDKIKGTVRVESEFGKSTTVFLTIPNQLPHTT